MRSVLKYALLYFAIVGVIVTGTALLGFYYYEPMVDPSPDLAKGQHATVVFFGNAAILSLQAALMLTFVLIAGRYIYGKLHAEFVFTQGSLK